MKNILICPLNWGMGHATRVKQIAAYLMASGHNVSIAAPDNLLELFDDSLCNNKIRVQSPVIKYSSKLPQYLFVALQSPVLILNYFRDLYKFGRLVKKYNIDILISDNRFGARSSLAWSVYITHQLTIILPSPFRKAGKISSLIHRKIASSFNECWIPDSDSYLSGKLSLHNNTLTNVKDIGLLSMLGLAESRKPVSLPSGKFYTVILSGPEPQKSILRALLYASLSGKEEQYVFACGDHDTKSLQKNKNITLYSYLDAGELRYVIENCEGLICRAGYSTIMDLVYMGKSALLIPTPGQTEQEYLASHLSSKGLFNYILQSDIQKAETLNIPQNTDFKEFNLKSSYIFKEVIDGLVKRSSSQ